MRRRIREYIMGWQAKGYSSGIPDEACPQLEALNKAPSYRAICKAILKNDVALTSLGFARPDCDAYIAIKREEIARRGKK
jgi:predicted phosphoadenosine phosphosulfate sulfurtransferase